MHPITPHNSIPDFNGLAAQGWSVFLMPRGSKIPSGSWKRFQTEHPTEKQIADWQGEIANVGIVTGRLSNLLVLDVDSPEAQAAVDQLELPRTPTVKTSKGRHYYFQHPHQEIRNSVRVRGLKLDIRGEGGIVVGPGSQHPDGTIYSWEVSPSDCSPAELPAEILADLVPPRDVAVCASGEADGRFLEAGPFSTWINREVQAAIIELRKAREGERNDTLFRLAARLANHAAALDLPWQQISDQLRPEALAIGLSGDETSNTLQSAWAKGSATPTAWVEIARKWIYVASRDRFWSPTTRQELTPKAFSMAFAEAMPYEKSNLATFLTKAGLVERVLDFRFEPGQQQGVISVAGEHFYNTYEAPEIMAIEGDCTPLVDFLEYLIPAEDERLHLVKMIAWTVANPGKKLSYALLLQSRVHGVGKSTLIEIWRELLGKRNTRKTNSEEMDGAYQSYLADTLLVVLEELNLGSGIGVYNRLKDMITGETAVINEKYLKQREVPNFANFVFLSNLDAPVLIEQRDRRFFVLDTPAEARSSEYWTEFHSWWRAHLGEIKGFFDRIDVADFQPQACPPMTEAKAKLKLQSATPLAQVLQELIDERDWPFARGICTPSEIRASLRRAGLNERSPRKIASALTDLGCLPLRQTRLSDGSRKSPWALFDIEKWEMATPLEIREAFENPAMIGWANEEEAA